MKKKKRKNWKRDYRLTCRFKNICDCGHTMMCDHSQNFDSVCEKELCPKWNVRKEA